MKTFLPPPGSQSSSLKGQAWWEVQDSQGLPLAFPILPAFLVLGLLHEHLMQILHEILKLCTALQTTIVKKPAEVDTLP